MPPTGIAAPPSSPTRCAEQTPRAASAVAQPSRRPARAIRPLFRTGFEHGSRRRIDSHLRDAPLSATGPRRPPVWRCCPGRSSRPSRVELHGGRPANPTARVLAGSRRTAGGALAPGGQAGAFEAVDLAARTRHARGAVRPRESQVRTRRRLSDAGGAARGPPRSTGAGEGSGRGRSPTTFAAQYLGSTCWPSSVSQRRGRAAKGCSSSRRSVVAGVHEEGSLEFRPGGCLRRAPQRPRTPRDGAGVRRTPTPCLLAS